MSVSSFFFSPSTVVSGETFQVGGIVIDLTIGIEYIINFVNPNTGNIVIDPTTSTTITATGFDYNLSSLNFASGVGYKFSAANTSVDGVYTIGITIASGSSSFGATTEVTIQNPVPCFKEDSKILTFNETLEKEEYIPIQDIRVGMLVKTFTPLNIYNGTLKSFPQNMEGQLLPINELKDNPPVEDCPISNLHRCKHDYVKVEMIGKSQIYNSGNKDRILHRLYQYSNQEFPEIIEPLILTGGHSILVDELTEEQLEETMQVFGSILETDGKILLLSFLNEDCKPYEKKGNFTIYHLALENDNYYANYGIYANGLLVESCSKRYLFELSNMELIV